MLKVVQLILFGVLPYLAITLAAPELSDNDETPGIHDGIEADTGTDGDDERGPDEAA